MTRSELRFYRGYCESLCTLERREKRARIKRTLGVNADKSSAQENAPRICKTEIKTIP